MVWKERNQRGFEEVEGNNSKLRDEWIHYLSFLCLGHDINRMEDFGHFIDLMTDL